MGRQKEKLNAKVWTPTGGRRVSPPSPQHQLPSDGREDSPEFPDAELQEALGRGREGSEENRVQPYTEWRREGWAPRLGDKWEAKWAPRWEGLFPE